MDRDFGKNYDVVWVARAAHRLRQRWPHADLTSLEEAAIELWDDEALRAMPAVDAVEQWVARADWPS